MSIRSASWVFVTSVILGALGCSAGPRGGSEGEAAETFVKPTAPPSIPHVEVTDKTLAGAVVNAIEAILSFRAYPLDKDGAGYELQDFFCNVPTAGNDAPLCSFEYRIGSEGEFFDVTIADITAAPEDGIGAAVGSTNAPQRPTLAVTLYRALVAARVSPRNIITLSNVEASRTKVSFDDKSDFKAPPRTDVTVDGDAAQALRDAVSNAGITDDDGSLRFICNTNGGRTTPSCVYQHQQMTGRSLEETPSQAIWDAILAAAKASGYKPLVGTLDQSTVLNASNFNDDDTKVSFALFQSSSSGTLPAPGGWLPPSSGPSAPPEG